MKKTINLETYLMMQATIVWRHNSDFGPACIGTAKECADNILELNGVTVAEPVSESFKEFAMPYIRHMAGIMSSTDPRARNLAREAREYLDQSVDE